ncbi:MAG: hypothetical protein WAQ25_00915 [Candidatus Saccharimonas sp.]
MARFTKLLALLRHPVVRRVLAWLLPIIIGRVLARYDKTSKSGPSKKRR